MDRTEPVPDSMPAKGPSNTDFALPDGRIRSSGLNEQFAQALMDRP